MLISGHGMAVVQVSSRQLWLPAQDLHQGQVSQNSSMDGPSLIGSRRVLRETVAFLWGWGHWQVARPPADNHKLLSGLRGLLITKRKDKKKT